MLSSADSTTDDRLEVYNFGFYGLDRKTCISTEEEHKLQTSSDRQNINVGKLNNSGDDLSQMSTFSSTKISVVM